MSSLHHVKNIHIFLIIQQNLINFQIRIESLFGQMLIFQFI